MLHDMLDSDDDDGNAEYSSGSDSDNSGSDGHALGGLGSMRIKKVAADARLDRMAASDIHRLCGLLRRRAWTRLTRSRARIRKVVTSLAVGSIVELHGLVGRPELNGQRGVIVSLRPTATTASTTSATTERFGVRINSPAGGDDSKRSSRRPLALRPANLARSSLLAAAGTTTTAAAELCLTSPELCDVLGEFLLPFLPIHAIVVQLPALCRATASLAAAPGATRVLFARALCPAAKKQWTALITEEEEEEEEEEEQAPQLLRRATSTIHDTGVFATQALHAHTALVVVGGAVCSEQRLQPHDYHSFLLTNGGYLNIPGLDEVSGEPETSLETPVLSPFGIAGVPGGQGDRRGMAHYVNHACAPNAEVVSLCLTCPRLRARLGGCAPKADLTVLDSEEERETWVMSPFAPPPPPHGGETE
jgi:hypothetical protein